MELRIHHFFDIIRDFGINKEIVQHPYGHSYHRIAQIIRNDPDLKMRISSGVDDVCEGCLHLVNGQCDDTIGHRNDFSSKEAFNDHIDKRILGKCSINAGEILTPAEICGKANKYLDCIFWIYEGNDKEHTQTRKKNVIAGLNYYKNRHFL